MCEIACLMWERRLTNAAGGNFAVRAGENSFLMTPSMMAEDKHCRLAPEDLMLVGFDQTIIEGHGRLSRETEMHAALLENFSCINAVIHAHPANCMVFAAAERPIPSVTEATEEAGAAGLVKFAPKSTSEMSANVLAYYKERRALVEERAVGCVLPRHGVVVTGKSLNNCFAMLELIETDAYCTLHLDKAQSARWFFWKSDRGKPSGSY